MLPCELLISTYTFSPYTLWKQLVPTTENRCRTRLLLLKIKKISERLSDEELDLCSISLSRTNIVLVHSCLCYSWLSSQLQLVPKPRSLATVKVTRRQMLMKGLKRTQFSRHCFNASSRFQRHLLILLYYSGTWWQLPRLQFSILKGYRDRKAN